MNDIIFLPVKPKWAELIMSGAKTLELRKRLPTRGWGNRCVIYSSSPRCEIVGTCTFVDCGRIVVAADELLSKACITRGAFNAYFGVGEQYCITLADPTLFRRSIPLATMRAAWSLEPPQQWRYIDGKTFDEIVRAGR